MKDWRIVYESGEEMRIHRAWWRRWLGLVNEDAEALKAAINSHHQKPRFFVTESGTYEELLCVVQLFRKARAEL